MTTKNHDAPQPVTPWTREVARRTAVQAGVVLTVVVLALLLWVGRQVVLLLFASGLLAVALQGLTAPIVRRTRMHYGMALALVTLAIAALLVLAATVIGPQISQQLLVLGRDLPDALARLRGQIDDYAWGVEALQRTDDLQRSVTGLGGRELWARVAGVFSTVAGGVGAILVIVVAGIYLAAGAHRYVEALVRLFPQNRRQRMEEVARHAVYFMRWWLLGRFATMVFVGVTTGIGLALLGVPLALTFGILAGLLDFVPNIGPLIAAAPVVLLALVQSPTRRSGWCSCTSPSRPSRPTWSLRSWSGARCLSSPRASSPHSSWPPWSWAPWASCSRHRSPPWPWCSCGCSTSRTCWARRMPRRGASTRHGESVRRAAPGDAG